MSVGSIDSPDRFRLTLCRGDSLLVQRAVYENVSLDDCWAVVRGAPFSLVGHTISGQARVVGTDRIVPVLATLVAEGSTTTPAEFRLTAGAGDLAFAFDDGAAGLIEVRVEARSVSRTFTLLKGLIRMRDSAARNGS